MRTAIEPSAGSAYYVVIALTAYSSIARAFLPPTGYRVQTEPWSYFVYETSPGAETPPTSYTNLDGGLLLETRSFGSLAAAKAWISAHIAGHADGGSRQ
jgi:hypothetical protein